MNCGLWRFVNVIRFGLQNDPPPPPWDVPDIIACLHSAVHVSNFPYWLRLFNFASALLPRRIGVECSVHVVVSGDVSLLS